MSLEGVVQDGVVVLGSGQTLPEGTHVEIVVKDSVNPQSSSTNLQSLLQFAGAVKDLPPDMALHHDHYLHAAKGP